MESNRALVVVETEYLEEQYRANVRTGLRDLERVELRRDGAVFNAVLWTLAEFEIDADPVSGRGGRLPLEAGDSG